MIITITLALSFLVALNFLLLIFSCSKTTKSESQQAPPILKVVKPKVETAQITSRQLAPTGS